MLKLVVYAANTGVRPDHISIPDDYRWSMTDSPGTPTELGTTMAALTPEGILHISDTDSGHRCVYARYDTLDSADNAIFEINCHLNSSGGSYVSGSDLPTHTKRLRSSYAPDRFSCS